MVRENEIRENEVVFDPPQATDAGLVFIGRVSTPWTSRMETPRQGRHDGPICRIEIFEPWCRSCAVSMPSSGWRFLYWLDRSRRNLVLQQTDRSAPEIRYPWLGLREGLSGSRDHRPMHRGSSSRTTRTRRGRRSGLYITAAQVIDSFEKAELDELLPYPDVVKVAIA